MGDPAELGFDPAALERVTSEAQPGTGCVAVIRHGELVGEWYYGDKNELSSFTVFSITQPVSATLVGIAQAEGKLHIDDKVSKYLPEWQGTEAEDVTIRHLLTDTSGRESTRGIANQELYNRFFNSEDPAAFAAGVVQEHPPGTVWSHNVATIELLRPILTQVTGMDPADYAQQKLFGPLGMKSTMYTKNGAGHTWMHNFLQTTCRDAARFGYMLLRKGNWNGTQIVPEEWVTEATTSSQDLNPGFGFSLWLNRPGSLITVDEIRAPGAEPPPDQQLLPGAPEDMIWAIGLGGQVIQVQPSTDTVVVRFGEAGSEEGGGVRFVAGLMEDAFVGD